jgi:hypothetical protein
MIQFTPILRGEGKAFRLTFINAETSAVIDTTAWTLKVELSEGHQAPHFTEESTPDVAMAALGQMSVIILDAITTDLSGSQIIRFLVDSGSGTFVHIVSGECACLDADDYRQSVYKSGLKSSTESDTYVQALAEEPQNITVNVSVDLDPTFDIGVKVKFNQLDPETLEYLEALQADVTEKHTEVMGV